MYLHAKMPEGRFYKVIDVDTGKEIEECIEADDQKGTYTQFVRDENHNLVKTKDGLEYALRTVENAKIKFVRC